ncbi:MAG: polymer-forming cytoskeletal protein [Nitrospirota bacterium]|nr:polymer-forming cytoskeletal protein [Nitrospirota bacterium]
MWNRKPSGDEIGTAAPQSVRADTMPNKDHKNDRSASMNAVAMIGKSIVIKGELSGNEDLTIEGTVEGKISLTENSVMVGADGRVTANIFARTITITGKVEGDVTATERIEITASGSVKGNLRAPRLVITDGAFFQGSVEMGKPTGAVKGVESRPAAGVVRPAPEAEKSKPAVSIA